MQNKISRLNNSATGDSIFEEDRCRAYSPFFIPLYFLIDLRSRDFNYFHGVCRAGEARGGEGEGQRAMWSRVQERQPRCSTPFSACSRSRSFVSAHARPVRPDNFMASRDSAACRQITEPNRVVRVRDQPRRDAFAGYIGRRSGTRAAPIEPKRWFRSVLLLLLLLPLLFLLLHLVLFFLPTHNTTQPPQNALSAAFLPLYPGHVTRCRIRNTLQAQRVSCCIKRCYSKARRLRPSLVNKFKMLYADY